MWSFLACQRAGVTSILMTQKLEFREGKILPKAMIWQADNMSGFKSKLVFSSTFLDEDLFYALCSVNSDGVRGREYGPAYMEREARCLLWWKCLPGI